uniref:PRA1 family protein 3-like n=1 Tax=Myxine glutinosa TaxID=7769 RepID=UPI00359024BD
MPDLIFPPLRSFHDFVSASARFGLPDGQDVHKWNNRVINNLHYYQSNYFVLAICVFLLVGCLQPVHMVEGLAIVAVGCWGASLVKSYWPYLQALQGEKLGLMLAGTAAATVLFIHYFLSGILFFLCAVILSVLVVILHASLRLRNIKNKLSNRIEEAGLKQTPMGVLLSSFGQELIPIVSQHDKGFQQSITDN